MPWEESGNGSSMGQEIKEVDFFLLILRLLSKLFTRRRDNAGGHSLQVQGVLKTY